MGRAEHKGTESSGGIPCWVQPQAPPNPPPPPLTQHPPTHPRVYHRCALHLARLQVVVQAVADHPGAASRSGEQWFEGCTHVAGGVPGGNGGQQGTAALPSAHAHCWPLLPLPFTSLISLAVPLAAPLPLTSSPQSGTPPRRVTAPQCPLLPSPQTGPATCGSKGGRVVRRSEHT